MATVSKPRTGEQGLAGRSPGEGPAAPAHVWAPVSGRAAKIQPGSAVGIAGPAGHPGAGQASPSLDAGRVLLRGRPRPARTHLPPNLHTLRVLSVKVTSTHAEESGVGKPGARSCLPESLCPLPDL